MPAAAARSIFSASGSPVNSTSGRGAVSCSVDVTANKASLG